jgi:hypothetical protein
MHFTEKNKHWLRVKGWEMIIETNKPENRQK